MSNQNSRNAQRARARIEAMESAYAAILEASKKANFGTEDKEWSIIHRAEVSVDQAIKGLYEIAKPHG